MAPRLGRQIESCPQLRLIVHITSPSISSHPLTSIATTLSVSPTWKSARLIGDKFLKHIFTRSSASEPSSRTGSPITGRWTPFSPAHRLGHGLVELVQTEAGTIS